VGRRCATGGQRRAGPEISLRLRLSHGAGSQRILKEEEGQVTFNYKASEDQQWHTLTLAAPEFIRRFLQHSLPSGFQRVRHYGWLSAAAHTRWERILALLDWTVAPINSHSQASTALSSLRRPVALDGHTHP